jgi:hypothetical protein
MSSELRMLTAEQVRDLARRLVAAEPLLGAAPAERLLAELGWKRVEDAGRATMILADPGLGVAPGKTVLSLAADGTVRNLGVPICDIVPRPITPEGTAFLQDAFALAGRALADEFGPAHFTTPGDNAELGWTLGTATIVLSRRRNVVNLYLWRTADYEAGE